MEDLEREEEKVRVSIKWESTETKEASFANHATVHFDGSVYTLRFYQVLPPPGLDLNDIPRQISARHIITLAISAGDMPAIAKLLQGAKTE